MSKSKLKITTEEFITKSKAKHGDKYDYSKSEYAGGENKVRIICPIHGEFQQRGGLHMRSSGCQKCGWERIAALKRTPKETFLSEAEKIHGDKYNY